MPSTPGQIKTNPLLEAISNHNDDEVETISKQNPALITTQGQVDIKMTYGTFQIKYSPLQYAALHDMKKLSDTLLQLIPHSLKSIALEQLKQIRDIPGNHAIKRRYLISTEDLNRQITLLEKGMNSNRNIIKLGLFTAAVATATYFCTRVFTSQPKNGPASH